MAGETSAREMVLRAMAASEIAESATSAELRRSFNALTEQWLAAASEAERGDGEPPPRMPNP